MNHQLGRPPEAPVYFPGELFPDVLSFLPVKSVLRLKCVSKTLNSLVSDPTFVNLHLNRSARNNDHNRKLVYSSEWNTFSFRVFRIFENPPIIFNLREYPYYYLNERDKDCFYIVGSCNGLVCLHGHCFNDDNTVSCKWLRIRNPATRTISEKIWCNGIDRADLRFGYDNSTNTYKVFYFIPLEKQIRVLTLGDNVWRNIQNSPVDHCNSRNLVHVGGSVNWLVICKHFATYDCKNFTIKRFAIISLNLGTETHTQFLPPPGFDEVPSFVPKLSVLKDCLCFSLDFEQTHFVIWQMKEFGVEESWAQFLKICYQDFLVDYDFKFKDCLLPICYSEQSDTLFLKNNMTNQAIIFNRRYNRIERIITLEYFSGHNYVESLTWYS